MEDKQIYTTARSEEIKRQIKSGLDWLDKKYRNYQKLQSSRKSKVVKQQTISPSEKKQNVMLSYKAELKETSAQKKSGQGNKVAKFKGGLNKIKLFTFLTYLLSFVIIGILVWSIYRTYVAE